MNNPNNAPESGHKSYINLGGQNYQVRVKERERQILIEGEWISVAQFVNDLFNAHKWDMIKELIAAAGAK